MDAKSYSQVRQNMASTMEYVCDTHEPVIITRKNAKPVVMMSLESYNSLQETVYLLKSPENAAKLAKSIDEYEKGKSFVKELIEDDSLD
jgi:antitoxin YefM